VLHNLRVYTPGLSAWKVCSTGRIPYNRGSRRRRGPGSSLLVAWESPKIPVAFRGGPGGDRQAVQKLPFAPEPLSYACAYS